MRPITYRTAVASTYDGKVWVWLILASDDPDGCGRVVMCGVANSEQAARSTSLDMMRAFTVGLASDTAQDS